MSLARLLLRRHVSRPVLLVAAAAAVLGGAVVAYAFFSGAGSGAALSTASTVGAGQQPTATASGSSVTVSWGQATLANGTPVAGYSIKRYDVNGVTQTVNASCSGVIAALSCTETNVPNGSFTYTDTPLQNNWHGAESPKSAQVVVSNTTQTATTTSVASSVNPSGFGQTVHFTATVAPTSGTGTPSGTVQFSIDGVNLGSAASMSGGSATSPATGTLAVGPHTVGATYSGDTSFSGSSGSLTQTVNKADTTTVVTSSANPSVSGQSVTLTATVSATAPGSGIPGGTVQFAIDGSNVGSAAALSSGSASMTTSTLGVGSHTVAAAYSGDGSFNSSSGTLSQTVNKDGTSTAVSSATNPSVFGQSVTFTATVSAGAPGAGIPTGTVTFKDGSATLGKATLGNTFGNGSATFTTSALSVGNHSITASYGGDGNFLSSASSALQQVVNKDATTTTLTSSSNPAVFGQPVTFTATITANAPGSGTPGGSVTFADGATTLATVSLTGGSASFTTSALSVNASHTIGASYGGDASFLTSSTTISQAVNKDDTMTSLTATTANSVFGQNVTFTATVSASAPGAGTPSGAVSFRDGGASIGSGTVDSSGHASFSTTTLAVGSHTITAVYSGDGSFNTSTSSAVTESVSQASTSTSLASGPNPSVFGQMVTFTATVSVTSPGAGTPTGSVTFTEGSTTLSSGTLDGTGHASFSTTSLAVGSHSVVAAYAGDSSFSGSSSGTQVQVVNKAGTTTTVTSSVNPSNAGQNVTFSATVVAVAPGAGQPTGLVSFSDGGTSLGSASLDSSGHASVSTSSLSAGTHTITASYAGDGNFNGSSGTVVQSVNSGLTSTTTALAASSLSTEYGQNVTFNASVSTAGSGTPTGTVSFIDGGSATLGTAPLGSGGHASLTTFSLAIGAHSITAAYNGDANFNGSQSNAVSVMVNGQCDVTWTGAAGDNLWSTAGNWSNSLVPGQVPGAHGGNATQEGTCIPSTGNTIVYDASAGSTSLKSLVSFSNLSLTGGELDLNPTSGTGSYIDATFTETNGGLGGSGIVMVNGVMTWTGGGMSGSGVTVIGSGSTGSVSGTVSLTNTRELRSAGSLTVDATDIQNNQGGAASLSTVAGGTLTLGGSTNRSWNGCCQGLTINNAGTLTKTGSDTVSGNFNLVNSGVVQVNGGTLTVQNGVSTPSTASGASYTVSSLATLENAGGTGTIAAGSFSGAGTFKVSSGTETINIDAATMPALVISGGTLVINGGTAGMDSAASLTLSSGSLSGTGTLTLTQASANGPALTWTGGAMGGSGVTVVGSGSIGNVTGTVSLTNTRELRSGGNLTLDPTDIQNSQGGAASLSTVTGGTLTLGNSTVDRSLDFCCQGLTINNAGTLTKTGSNAVRGNFSLINTGTVQVNAGTLTVANGISTPSTASGAAYTVSSGATLENAGGTGTIAAGTLGGDGTLTASGGTLTLSTVSSTTLPNLVVNGLGRLNINGNNSAASLTLSTGGNLGGTATLTLTQPSANGPALTWIAGTMDGSGITVLGAGSTGNVTTGTVGLTNTRELRVAGTLAFDPIDIQNNQGGAASLSTVAGGTLILGNSIASRTLNACCQALTINNAGTLTKMGINAVTGNFNLVNTGTVQVNAGRLIVQTGIGTPTGASSASYTVSSGATLENAGGTGTIAAGSFSGAGTFKVSSGTETINIDAATMPALVISGGTLVINGGTAGMDSAASLTLSSGSLSGTGTLTLTKPSANGPALTWTGGGMGGSGVTVVGSGSIGNVTGTVALTNTRELRAAGSLTLDPTDIQNSQGGAASLSTVTGGTLTLGNSTVDRSLDFCCQGLTINNAGTLTKTGSNTVSGNFNLVNSGTAQVNAGTLRFNGISTSSGASGASFSVNSGAILENAGGTGTIGAGTLGGGGTLSNSGGSLTISTVSNTTLPNLNVSGGSLNINGNNSAASLTLNGSGALGGSATLTLTGSLSWMSGAMNGSGVTVVGPSASGSVSGTVTLTNTRELRAAGSLTLDATDIQNNQGGAAILSTATGGTLTLGNGSTNRNWNGCCQALTINNAGTLTKPGSNTVSGNFSLVNSGTVNVDRGALGVNGTYTASTGATTALTIAGTTAGSGYAQLVVGAAASLNGLLSITTDPSFTPPNGSSYQVLTYGSHGTSQFSAVAFTGSSYTVTYNATNLTLGALSATSTALTSSANPNLTGTNVTFTATVSPAPAAGQTITFMDSSTTLGTGTTNGAGVATFTTTSPLSLGNHPISAAYAGDASHSSSTGTLTQRVTRILVSPTTAPANSNVTVTGASWPASASIQVWLGPAGSGNFLCFVTADTSGNVSQSCTVGQGIPQGTYAVTGTTTAVTDTGNQETITPAITSLQPNHANPGNTVTVYGAGFAANSGVTVMLGSTTVTGSVTTSSANGQVSNLQFSIPSGFAAGATTITVTDGAANSASIGFTVYHATIAISPTTQAANSAVTVTGAGWPASASIQIWLGPAGSGNFLCFVTADTSGNVSQSCTVGQGIPQGTYTVSATDNAITTSGNAETVTPAITSLQPNHGNPGNTVTVYGAGFAASSGVTVMLGSTTVTGSVTTSSANGQVSNLQFSIPSGFAAGATTITVTDSAANSASIGFTVYHATIAISPTTQAANSAVTVTGAGWPASASIQIWLGPVGSGNFLCFVTADTSGNVSQSCTVGQGIPQGTYTVSATDNAITTSGNAETVTPAITSLQPNHANPGNTVTVYGAGFAANSGVTVMLGSTTVTGSVTTSSANGQVSNLQFSIPSGFAAGATTITVTDSAANSASIGFTVYHATIAISPTTVTRPANVSVSGAGWPASASIQIWLGPVGSGNFLCFVTADTSGNVAPTTCSISTGVAAGTYTVNASDSAITATGNQETVN